MTCESSLLKKYNREIPRYTSYPTVPYWEELGNLERYKGNFISRFRESNKKEGISLYLHLPFCEKMCTFCACNRLITQNHDVEEGYLQAISNEWKQYRDCMPEKPVIRELHLGGGTPTFFSPENLGRLLRQIFEIADRHPRAEFSLEGHPNNTTLLHLQMLYQFGFRRISYGVQDHDPEVQRIINRIQPYENVKRVTEQARRTGFNSVNYDLIYGLPRQTEKSIEKTIQETILLRPDRIAFYSYAHVPWKARGQRLYDEGDLPSVEQKLKFLLIGRELFLNAGYEDIGMDHFALPHDDLYLSLKNGTLHRNFMGYTSTRTNFLVGLGVSAISDTGTAYAQNTKALSNYYRAVKANQLPLTHGYFLDGTDLAMRGYILDVACKGRAEFLKEHTDIIEEYIYPDLKEFANDGLIALNKTGLTVTDTGRMFLRNICHAFDLKGKRSRQKEVKFSRAI